MQKLLLVIFTALLSCQFVHAQVVLQSYPLVDYNGGKPNDLAIDALDNLLITGNLTKNTGSLPIIKSIFHKKDQAGNLLWSADMVNQSNGEGKKVCTDAAGNIYVVGNFTGGSNSYFQLNGGPVITNAGNLNSFFAKYNFNGVLQWVKPFGGSGTAWFAGIECNQNGDVLIAGHTNSNQVMFGNNVTLVEPSNTNTTGFVVKFSAAGQAQWVTPVHGRINGFAITPSGEPCITGEFPASSASAPFAIDSEVYTGSTAGIFVAKLDSAGSPIWARTSASVTPALHNDGLDVATDAAGAVYMVAQHQYDIAIAGTTIAGVGNKVLMFAAKFDLSGGLVWSRPFEPNGASLSPTNYLTISLDATGNCYLASGFFDSVFVDGYTIANLVPLSTTEIFLCKLDQQGNYIWHINGGVILPTGYIMGATRIAFGSDNTCFFAGLLNVSIPSGWGDMTFGGYSSLESGGFIYKINPGNHANRLSGRVFYDENLNGLKDTTEFDVPGMPVYSQPLNYQNFSNQNGWFSTFTDTGNYILSMPFAPASFTVAPPSYTGFFSSSGNSDTMHFALQPIVGQQDLSVFVTAPYPPRPGFAYPVYVTYRNVGTTTQSGSVELQLDSLLQIQNSVPVQNSQTGNTLSWSFTNLAPLQSGIILINAQVPATTILGTTIHQLASVSPLTGDLSPADNTDTDSAIVVGSYDPNDKQVNLTSLTPTQVQNEEWLEYTIRFQNTGTDTAFTVRLADTLSAMLNIPTIEVLSSSHPNTWSIKGAGIMEFRFDNILLPDSNANEAASQGFVKYRIKPKTNLALGDLIENTAYIYFDFNAPIVTNTATTEVKLVNSVATLERNPLHIYPNPNRGEFTLQCNNIWALQVSAELRNVLGQTVWQQNLQVENGKLQQVIRTSNLSKGVYYLQVKTEKGSKVQKVVIE